jgi:glutaminase
MNKQTGAATCRPQRRSSGRLMRCMRDNKSNTDGKNSQLYPALAQMPSELFGICVVGKRRSSFRGQCGARVFDHERVEAVRCCPGIEAIGAEQARQKLGANATGLPFNALAAVEWSGDRRTNPKVAAGAIATTSLVPGVTADEKWKFIHDGLCQFAGRPLSLDEAVCAGDKSQLPQSGHGTSAPEFRTNLL